MRQGSRNFDEDFYEGPNVAAAVNAVVENCAQESAHRAQQERHGDEDGDDHRAPGWNGALG
jgi:hypothetical protein